MQLHQKINNVERSGVSEEGSFTIKTSAKAFQILSSSLYQDKIAAVVRELSCNAYDSHVAAGNPGKPFQLRLPGTLSQKFSIRDFGTGLPHDKVMSLYTTYFDSSKDSDNQFIGALGLGSKSPFSYVSTFSVTSYFNGLAKMYSAFIGEDGTPRIALLASNPSNEPNGLEVSLASKPGDEGKFRNAVRDQLKFFKVKPDVVGRPDFEWEEVTEKLRGTSWFLQKYEYGVASVALMGQVGYPIKADIFPSGSEEEALLGIGIVLELKLGDCDIAPSREALSYDPETVRNLSRILKNVRQEIAGQIENEIKTAPTYWEACKKYGELFSQNGPFVNINRLKGIKPEWNNRKLQDYLPLELGRANNPVLTAETKSSYDLSSKNPKIGWSGRDIQIHPKDSFIFYVDAPLPWERVRQWNRDRASVTGRPAIPNRWGEDSFQIVMLKGEEAELTKALDLLGNPEYIRLSTIDIPKNSIMRTPVAKVKKLGERGYLEDTNLDFSVSGYFCYLHGTKWIYRNPQKTGTSEPYGYARILREKLANLGLMKADEPIYFVNATYWPRLKKCPNLVEFYSGAREILRIHLAGTLEESLQKWMLSQELDNLSNVVPLANTRFKKLVDPILPPEPKNAKELKDIIFMLDYDFPVTKYDPKALFNAFPQELKDYIDYAANSYSRDTKHPTFKFLVDQLATKLGV